MKSQHPNINEKFLTHIWNQQYLQSKLFTIDGREIIILDVGTLNNNSGPDFLNAKIKIGKITYFGDVEIHKTIYDWFQHKHQYDAKYNKVILHVVLKAEKDFNPTISKSGRIIPVLFLEKFLPESIYTIWHKTILDERIKKSETIFCNDINDNVSPEIINKFVSKLALERLEFKLRRYEERLKQLANEKRMTLKEAFLLYGHNKYNNFEDEIPPPFIELSRKDYSKKELWEQILYEGIMDCLGYNKNSEPFIKLSQEVNLKMIKEFGFTNNLDMILSLLFGVSGLIPSIKNVKTKDPKTLDYLNKLSKNWQTIYPLYKSCLLNESDWQFFPTRPSNFPTIRIAYAACIIHKFLSNDFFKTIIQNIKSNFLQKQQEQFFIDLFKVEPIEYWKNHYSFNKSSNKNIRPIGSERILAIIINAIIPISLLYARIFKDKNVRNGALALFYNISSSENNSILRLMNKQLLKSKVKLNKASVQQGLIQLYKYYCAEKKCAECDIAKSIKVSPLNN